MSCNICGFEKNQIFLGCVCPKRWRVRQVDEYFNIYSCAILNSDFWVKGWSYSSELIVLFSIEWSFVLFFGQLCCLNLCKIMYIAMWLPGWSQVLNELQNACSSCWIHVFFGWQSFPKKNFGLSSHVLQ
jgi:hypothetical protein